MFTNVWQQLVTFLVGAFFLASRTFPVTGVLLMIGAVVVAVTEYLTRDYPNVDPQDIDAVVEAIELKRTDPVAGEEKLRKVLLAWAEDHPSLRRPQSRVRIRLGPFKVTPGLGRSS